jgi:NitT/TauT family transport system substrate-binding protein
MSGGRFAAAGETVNYRLKWILNTSVVGDLYADVHGMFAAKGLDVSVKAGSPERDAIKELELGYAQFGAASADQVIRARSKGARVVVLAQLFQINPLQWIYRSKEITLDKLADLKGKTIGVTYGGNDETIMRTLLNKAAIKESQVNLFSVRFDYTPFYQKKVDIWPVYRNSQGIFIARKLEAAGESVGFFKPAEHGVTFVANSVVTSEKIFKEKPQLVKKFMTALLEGWEAAMNPKNSDKAVSTVMKFDKDNSRSVIAEQLKITRDLVWPDQSQPFGRIDSDGWRQTEEIMLAQKVISKPVNITSYLKPIP